MVQPSPLLMRIPSKFRLYRGPIRAGLFAADVNPITLAVGHRAHRVFSESEVHRENSHLARTLLANGPFKEPRIKASSSVSLLCSLAGKSSGGTRLSRSKYRVFVGSLSGGLCRSASRSAVDAVAENPRPPEEASPHFPQGNAESFRSATSNSSEEDSV
jgi:hypothetical protein